MKMEANKNYFRFKVVLGMLVVFISIVSCSKIHKVRDIDVGVNYGRLGSNLPPPEEVLELITSLSIRHVKTFDMDPAVTKAFANTGISLSLCVPDDRIPSLASNSSEAILVVETFILPFHKRTRIYSISIGNEVSTIDEFAQLLLPAMENMYLALRKFRLHKRILVSTPHSLAILAIVFPPSGAVFQESIAESVLWPVLSFLNRTKSPFMVNVYPYLTYNGSSTISLDFALFSEAIQSLKYTDPNTNLTYTNLFDVMVDAVSSAAYSLGFHDLPLVVSETGWPSQGSPDDTAASLQNAEIFNKRLIKHVNGKPIKGTPLRPGVPIPTYIFSLFDEDQKPGAPVENHWGILYANGTRLVYSAVSITSVKENRENCFFNKAYDRTVRIGFALLSVILSGQIALMQW